jgi:hypothetical protein
MKMSRLHHLPRRDGRSRSTACRRRVPSTMPSRSGWSLAIAIFGVLLGRTFEARVRSRIDGLALPSPARHGIDRELRKIAGADLTQVPVVTRGQQGEVREVIDHGFVFAFRLVMIGAGVAGGCRGRVENATRTDPANR